MGMARDFSRVDDGIDALSRDEILCFFFSLSAQTHRKRDIEDPTDSHKPVGMSRGCGDGQSQEELHGGEK